MVDKDFILAPQIVRVNIMVDQTYSMFHAMTMLSHYEKYPGLDPWMEKTARSLPAERYYDNRLISDALYGAIKLKGTYPDFPAYIDSLEQQDPLAMRMGVFEKACYMLEIADPSYFEKLLAETDRMGFVTTMRTAYRNHNEKYEDESEYGNEFFLDFYDLLLDPPKMKVFILSHVHWMWENILAPEWAKVEPMIQESAAAYQLDYSGLSANEAIQAVTGRDMRGKWDEELEKADTMIFIPSPHIGPYLSMFGEEKVTRIIFRARLPEGTKAGSSALSRSELLVRLNALADDNRLRILELIANEGEMCAQDIISKLAFSQSAASRHLRQLSATGYLEERTKHGAKCYSLNMDRVGETLQALKRFLSA